MSNSFIFRPHIMEACNVVTPDLLVDDVYLADGSNDDEMELSRLPVDRLISDPAVQVTSAETVADGSIVLMGAGGGMLVGLASNHRPLLGDPQLFAKPLSRQAWRYEHVVDHWKELLITVRAGDGKILQEGTVQEFTDFSAVVSAVTGGHSELASGVTVLCSALALPAKAARRYELSLFDPKLDRTLSFTYDVHILTTP